MFEHHGQVDHMGLPASTGSSAASSAPPDRGNGCLALSASGPARESNPPTARRNRNCRAIKASNHRERPPVVEGHGAVVHQFFQVFIARYRQEGTRSSPLQS